MKATIVKTALFLLLVNVTAGQLLSRQTDFRVNSTLEVLQDAELYPSKKMLCGPVCLYLGARYFGIENYSINDIAEMSDWDIGTGASMLGLEKACGEMGLFAEGVELTVEKLGEILEKGRTFAIIENDSHFYLFTKKKNDSFLVITTSMEPKWMETEKVYEGWNGKALLFSKTPINLNGTQGRVLFYGGIVGLSFSVPAILILLLKSKKR